MKALSTLALSDTSYVYAILVIFHLDAKTSLDRSAYRLVVSVAGFTMLHFVVLFVIFGCPAIARKQSWPEDSRHWKGWESIRHMFVLYADKPPRLMNNYLHCLLAVIHTHGTPSPPQDHSHPQIIRLASHIRAVPVRMDPIG